MLETDYLSNMVHYYNEARLPQKPGDAAGFFNDVQRDPNHWAHEMVQDLRAFVSGRRVLEVACGMGRWTQFAAETAGFVLATDAAPNLLANAEGLRLPRDRVRFRCVNAFDIGSLKDEFVCAMHLNFFNHLPAPAAARFLSVLHARLGPGGRVFAAGQQYSANWKQQMYTRDGSPDTFSMRREDGFNFELVDNEFDESRVRQCLAGAATNLQVKIGRAFWWATYTVSPAS